MKLVALLLMSIAYFALASGYDCETNGVRLNMGEKYQLEDRCAELICEASGNGRVQGCAIASLSPNCKIIPGDLSKPYPKCCESYEC